MALQSLFIPQVCRFRLLAAVATSRNLPLAALRQVPLSRRRRPAPSGCPPWTSSCRRCLETWRWRFMTQLDPMRSDPELQRQLSLSRKTRSPGGGSTRSRTWTIWDRRPAQPSRSGPIRPATTSLMTSLEGQRDTQDVRRQSTDSTDTEVKKSRRL